MSESVSLTNAQKIAYSSGNFSVNLISQTFATFAVFYYVDVLGVKPVLISLAMVIHGIFNAFMNPLFGYLSDRTRTRFGRRIPYILFGMLPLGAAFTLIWLPLAHGPAVFWYFLIIVLIYDILYVLVILNWTSLFPEMFTTLKERSFVSAWRQMLGIIGMVLGVAIPSLLYGSIGWSKMAILFGALTVIVLAISLWGSKENPNAPIVSFSFLKALRYTFYNKSFVTFVLGSFFVQFTFVLIPAVMPFFAKYVLQIPEAQNTILLASIFAVAIPMVYVWGILSNKFGTRKMIMTAVILYMAALIPFTFVNQLWSATVATGAVGFSLAGIIVLLDVLLSEVIDEDEQKSGARREGMYFGMNGFVVRWGVSMQAIVMGWVLTASGYVANAPVQTPATLTGLRLMLSVIPIAALLLALLCFYLYPINTHQKASK